MLSRKILNLSLAPRIAALITLGLVVSGCIRPLYGEMSAAQAVRPELQAIDVKPVADVTGHYLREELIFNLTGGTPDSQLGPAKYILTITTSDQTLAAALDTSESENGRADAASVQVTANYKLTTLKGGVITEGTVTASGSIDRLTQRFAALRAVRDAKIRVAKTLADMIQTRLAAHFASKN
jgi:LPS-assembly lipoprotein